MGCGEGARILDKIKDREYVYALAILGKERFSEEFADCGSDNLWPPDLTFVIGGSLGLFKHVLEWANTLISLAASRCSIN